MKCISISDNTTSNTFPTMLSNITLFVVCAILAVVTAQSNHGQSQHQIGHEDHAAYKFEYGVQDPHTHDVHSQKEHREGKHVVGEYTLHEPDGTQRVVKYVSDPHTGFEAIVERKGHAQHPAHYGKHKGKGQGGTSYVGITHWSNQGHSGHGH